MRQGCRAVELQSVDLDTDMRKHSSISRVVRAEGPCSAAGIAPDVQPTYRDSKRIPYWWVRNTSPSRAWMFANPRL